MLIVDGHLDLAMNALLYERDITLPLEALRQREAGGVAEQRGTVTLSLPELRTSRAAVVAGTLIARAKPWIDPARTIGRGDIDYPSADMAYAVAMGQLAWYRLLEERGEIRLITTQAGLDKHLARWERGEADPPVGVILLMEGADPIVEPGQVAAWCQAGLRLVSLAHFGHSRYAAGTPPTDPAEGEQDAPLTPRGRELLKKMKDQPIALDLSHLSDTSFFEAAERFEGPVCASHSNARALTKENEARQISDEQIRIIARRGGVIGMAMHWCMLKPTARRATLEHVAEHVDHVCQLAGSARHVGIGSDLDGGFGVEDAPEDVTRYRDVRQLADRLRERGMSEEDVAGVFAGNWLAFYRRVLPG
ncbi:MAG: dipeptidase [Phycisphaeraceae bacterium]